MAIYDEDDNEVDENTAWDRLKNMGYSEEEIDNAIASDLVMFLPNNTCFIQDAKWKI